MNKSIEGLIIYSVKNSNYDYNTYILMASLRIFQREGNVFHNNNGM